MNSVKSFNEINKDISIALEYELYCHRELLRLEALEIGHWYGLQNIFTIVVLSFKRATKLHICDFNGYMWVSWHIWRKQKIPCLQLKFLQRIPMGAFETFRSSRTVLCLIYVVRYILILGKALIFLENLKTFTISLDFFQLYWPSCQSSAVLLGYHRQGAQSVFFPVSISTSMGTWGDCASQQFIPTSCHIKWQKLVFFSFFPLWKYYCISRLRKIWISFSDHFNGSY